ncbi:hypothetical protein AM4_142 [Lactococcus phage AM4]|uniref:Uncharacterized protein n=2 Tax=Audreyjarvisvirus AM4 TaxID=2845189 RepID=A0A1W6JKM6_9CAUD|nr:hypothetical protein H1Z35_gp110 [Lactococcus phage AM4]ARM66800.1 hypothetical protein AM4_142 [Lactococcus phage AM4]ARM66897.1 hypothetical protein AM5_044 [Lactococcus phage AM5]
MSLTIEEIRENLKFKFDVIREIKGLEKLVLKSKINYLTTQRVRLIMRYFKDLTEEEKKMLIK